MMDDTKHADESATISSNTNEKSPRLQYNQTDGVVQSSYSVQTNKQNCTKTRHKPVVQGVHSPGGGATVP